MTRHAILNSVVKAYKGDFIYRQGYPFIVTATHPIRGGEILSEIYIILQHVPDITKFTLEITVMTADGSTLRLMEDEGEFKDVKPVEFFSQESAEWVTGQLNTRNRVSCEQNNVAYQPPDYTIRPLDNWKDILRRLRFRGLPTTIFDRIREGCQSKPLLDWISTIYHDEPIKVRQVEPKSK